MQGAPREPEPDADVTPDDPATASDPDAAEPGRDTDAADANPNAVLLPGLIVDLFPNPPPGSTPEPTAPATPADPPPV